MDDLVNDAIAILIAYSDRGKDVWLANMKRVNDLREKQETDKQVSL